MLINAAVIKIIIISNIILVTYHLHNVYLRNFLTL